MFKIFNRFFPDLKIYFQKTTLENSSLLLGYLKKFFQIDKGLR